MRQTIVYEVAYERLAQLRFAIPEGVPPEQLRFFLGPRTARELLEAGHPFHRRIAR